MTDYQAVRTIEHDSGQKQHFATINATEVIWLLLGILEAVIAFRVVFKLIEANAVNPFATFLFKVTDLFVAPFAGLTGTLSTSGMVLEISSIIAMIVYLLIAWALEKIVYVFFYRTHRPVSSRQRIVTDNLPQQPPKDISQITITNLTAVQAPISAGQTTFTEYTNTQAPDSL